jgi:hypothetical protein
MPSPTNYNWFQRRNSLIYSDNVDDENILTGLIGLYAKYLYQNHFLQPEIYYTTKGAEQTYNNAFNGVAKFNINYIEVPVLAVINLTENLNIHAGHAAYGRKNN